VHRLAQWLAAKFSSLQDPATPTPAAPYPDSTTLPDKLGSPKLSSSTEEAAAGDLLAKSNPLLAESLAASAGDDLATAASADGKDGDLFSGSSSSSTSSPASASLATAAASSVASALTTAPSLSSGGVTRKSDTFHRPNADAADKSALRAAGGRRMSGKGCGVPAARCRLKKRINFEPRTMDVFLSYFFSNTNISYKYDECILSLDNNTARCGRKTRFSRYTAKNSARIRSCQ
jgi:hypothetical protein